MIRLFRKILRTLLFFLPESVVNGVFWETAAFIGRLFSRPLALGASNNYVNLGSGPNVIKGFINIDSFITPGIEYGADLRYPLKIPNDSIDGIFCEHTIEHMTYKQADSLLKECYRILKPGSYIRIALPDISIFIKNYSDGNTDWFSQWEYLMFKNSRMEERKNRKLTSNLEAISFVTQEYGHLSCWDFETLSRYLAKNNFRDISKCSFMQGSDKNLLIDLDTEDRKFVSLYAEAKKEGSR